MRCLRHNVEAGKSRTINLLVIQMSELAERFARCVKKVSKTLKQSSSVRRSSFKKSSSLPNKFSDKEGIAIAICTKNILWPQGRTLKHFSMRKGKPYLVTQTRKGGRRARK